MSDDSDRDRHCSGGDGRVIEFPGSGDGSYVPPPIPLYRDETAVPPESPEETTLELPAIPAPAHPAAFLASPIHRGDQA
ncbi:hypothetical protein AB0442_39930 [Kitasatospora sp. NPDC085895]|uniref:hypothetical protein n=1 Tax=Kitasatospora sp. NPDC085895 TaxID=3155057 RepID=UPI00344EDA91